MKVISIDPGYDRLGIAIIEKINNSEKLLFSECFTTSKKDDINTRNRDIGVRVRNLILEYNPDFMAIEGLFFSKNTSNLPNIIPAHPA